MSTRHEQPRAFIAERPSQLPFTDPLSPDRANELWRHRQQALDDRDAAVADMAAVMARVKALEAQLERVRFILEKNRGSVSAARLGLAVFQRGGA